MHKINNKIVTSFSLMRSNHRVGSVTGLGIYMYGE